MINHQLSPLSCLTTHHGSPCPRSTAGLSAGVKALVDGLGTLDAMVKDSYGGIVAEVKDMVMNADDCAYNQGEYHRH